MSRTNKLWAILLLAALPALAAPRAHRYALILEDPPLAAEYDPSTAKPKSRQALADRRLLVETRQDHLRQLLAGDKFTVLGATQTVLNAVYVAAKPAQLDQLRAMPGVSRVVELGASKPRLVRANDLVRSPQAWNLVNGRENAGQGVKIAVIDTGIDHQHPGMRDESLTAPAGYPRCRAEECAYTNSKVIAARSYVDLLVLPEEPEFSRPDDLSPRDRVGHGTAAAMVAAGSRIQSPLGEMSGVAPKAFLGNYKIFGSPGVNDVTFDNAVFEALEDAIDDGMDIALLAIGSPALWSPADRGGICSLPSNRPCDPRAEAVENATRAGLTVVVSAGNDGDLAVAFPALNSIQSPATAPSAISVGATTNANRYAWRLRVQGGGVPQDLQAVPALFGNGPRPPAPLAAPLRLASAVQDNGRACSPLGNDTLTGTLAVIDLGDCSLATKVIHAQRGGAVGAVLIRTGDSNFIFPPFGLAETGIPAVMIGGGFGAQLKQFLASNPDRPATMDTNITAVTQEPNFMAYFSSYGPSIGEGAIKPEVVAPGDQHYTATQSYDPNSILHSADGFIALQGTSFSAPMAAGAAALFKQRFPQATPAQVKSAVVNTSTDEASELDGDGNPIWADILAAGSGLLNVEAVARTNVTAEPATLSFGILTGAQLPSRGLRITNLSNDTVNIQVEVFDAAGNPSARVVVDQAAFSLGAGQFRDITARLDGNRPAPGIYQEFVRIRGGAEDLWIPYLYLVGDGVPANLLPLRGQDFLGNPNEEVPGRLVVKVIDRYGVPVFGERVQFRPASLIDIANDRTDELGIVEARAFLSGQTGDQSFTAEAGNLTLGLFGRAIPIPAISTNGVVNAASFRPEDDAAPGSYVSIFGNNLSEVFRQVTTPYLPLSLANISVSFDVPGRALSYPGRLHFVSSGQVNVQVPWELEGFNAVYVKVSYGDSSTSLYTLRLQRYSPAFFEYEEASSGRRLIAALDEGFQLVGTANPARRGRVVQLYFNGGGPVTNRPPSGEVSPGSPLAETLTRPTVTIGGRPAAVEFSGLAPGIAGLYQANVVVAPDTPSGLQPVVITMENTVSKTATLPVE